MIGRILASIGAGNLILSALDFGRAIFDLEYRSLFPDGVYEGGGDEAHRLDASSNHPSSRSSEPFLRTPRRECDIITLLHVLKASV